MGSTPIASSTGATIGTTTKIISIKSRIKPSTNITNITSSTAVKTPPGNWLKKPCTNSSPPKPRNTNENNDAPMRIIKIIALILMVDCDTSRRRWKLNCFFASASKQAPSAPTPAASVGVAAPIKIEPNTKPINNSTGSKLSNTRNRETFSSCASMTTRGIIVGRSQAVKKT